MDELLAPITAETVISFAKRMGLTIESRGGDVFFDLKDMTANPAGIAAMMREPRLARGNFGREVAMRAAGAELIGGLSFGYDVPMCQASQASDEFKAYAAVGREIRHYFGEP